MTYKEYSIRGTNQIFRDLRSKKMENLKFLKNHPLLMAEQRLESYQLINVSILKQLNQLQIT
jgi:hypothetical protein